MSFEGMSRPRLRQQPPHPDNDNRSAAAGSVRSFVRAYAPVSVAIAKFSQEIAAGTRLDPVLVPPRTSKLTGAKGRFYCGENQRTRSKFAEAMIGDMFSKYES